MDLLYKHYEKALLVFCVLGLFLGIFTMNRGSANQMKEMRKKENNAVQLAELTGSVKLENGSSLTMMKFLMEQNHPLTVSAKTYNDIPLQNTSPLQISPGIIVCPGMECQRLISFYADKCPYCSVKLPPAGLVPTMKDDLDGDGIPDLYEQQYERCMNWRDPRDASLDPDGDHFTNLQEYLLHTDPSDPESHPPLAHLLRVAKVMEVPLNFQLDNVDVSEDDPNVYEIRIHVNNEKKGRKVKVGEEISDFGYKIESLKFVQESEDEDPLPYVTLISMTDPEERYVDIPRTKRTRRAKPITKIYKRAVLYYIEDRTRDPLEFRRDKSKTLTVDERGTFVLSRQKRDSQEIHKETYEVVQGSANLKEGTIEVRPVEGVADTTVIRVPKFDRTKDLDRGFQPEEPLPEFAE